MGALLLSFTNIVLHFSALKVSPVGELISSTLLDNFCDNDKSIQVRQYHLHSPKSFSDISGSLDEHLLHIVTPEVSVSLLEVLTIQSIIIANNDSDSRQPCLTPEVILNQFERVPLILMAHTESLCKFFTTCINLNQFERVPLILMAHTEFYTNSLQLVLTYQANHNILKFPT